MFYLIYISTHLPSKPLAGTGDDDHLTLLRESGGGGVDGWVLITIGRLGELMIGDEVVVWELVDIHDSSDATSIVLTSVELRVGDVCSSDYRTSTTFISIIVI